MVLVAPAVRLDRLTAMVGDNPAVQAQLLALFLSSGRSNLAAIAAAAKHGSAPELYTAAHKFKSAARSIGADALAQTCEALERQAKSGDTAGCRLFAEQLAAHFEPVADFIAAHLAARDQLQHEE